TSAVSSPAKPRNGPRWSSLRVSRQTDAAVLIQYSVTPLGEIAGRSPPANSRRVSSDVRTPARVKVRPKVTPARCCKNALLRRFQVVLLRRFHVTPA